MLAVDTNILVRYFADDDPKQSAKARALIRGGNIFVCTTVILETEWVLRKLYGFSLPQIVGAIRGLAGLAGITMEDGSTLAQAMNWAESGLDLADSLHLARAEGCEAFVTFDRPLIRSAGKLKTLPVRAP